MGNRYLDKVTLRMLRPYIGHYEPLRREWTLELTWFLRSKSAVVVLKGRFSSISEVAIQDLRN